MRRWTAAHAELTCGALLKYGWHLICRWVGEDWEFIFVLASSGFGIHVGLGAFDIQGLIIDFALIEVAANFFSSPPSAGRPPIDKLNGFDPSTLCANFTAVGELISDRNNC